MKKSKVDCPECGSSAGIGAGESEHSNKSIEITIECSDCGYYAYSFLDTEDFVTD